MGLSNICMISIFKLGASRVINVDDFLCDPDNEEKFKEIQYEPYSLVITWQQYQSVYDDLKNKKARSLVRRYRDYIISKSDWVMSPDVFPTVTNKNEWIAYRQALRDLPATITEYIWKDNNYEELDFSQMNLPQPPPVLRT